MITCVCPSCGQKLRAPDAIAGKQVRCPHCATTVSVATPPPAASLSEAPTAAFDAAQNPSEQPTLTGPTHTATGGAIGLLAPAQRNDEIGRLGDYRVFSLLGQGGMGAVFQAEDIHLNRRVALKVILPELTDETARKRFLREARAAAAIEHANIVPVFQVGEVEVPEIGRVPFLAMPLLKGETLEARLKREGKLSPAEVCHIGSQVAVALAAAHEHGLVHRDIKPGNIWLEEKPLDPTLDDETRRLYAKAPRSVVKILDFGLARGADVVEESPRQQPLPASLGNKGIAATLLTQDGAIVGTPAYMPPEQINGQADARSDLFGLGCVLYQMTTGKLPFQGATTMDTLLAVAGHAPTPPRELDPRVPANLSKLIMRLLEKKPADRPKTALVVARKLARMTERHRGVSALVFGLMSVVCLFGIFCYGVTCVIGTILGLIGWWRGGSDLRKMKVGLMDQTGHGLTMTGYVCSIIGTILNSLGVLVCGGFMLFIFGMTSMTPRPSPMTNTRPTKSGISVPTPPDTTATNRPSAADALTRSDDLADLPAEVLTVLGGRRLRLHGAPHFPAFSRDGKLLASASGNAAILFDADTGQPRRTLIGHSGRVTALAFDARGATLLTGSEDRSVRVWDVRNGRLLDTWPTGSAVRDLAFSPDGQLLATATDDGTVSIGTLTEPARVREQVGSGAVHRLRFHPSGKMLATTCSDHRVRLLGVDGKQLWQADLAGESSFALDFSTDGTRLVAGSDEILETWQVTAGDKLIVTSAGSVKTAAGGLAAFIDGGKAILTAPHKKAGSLERWATRDLQKQPGLKLSATSDVLYSVISPDGRTLAWAAPSDRVLRLTDLATGKPLLTDDLAHSDAITALAFRPDAATLATADSAGRTIFWDLATAKATRPGPVHAGGVLGLTFTPDGKTLASCGKDGLRLWSVADHKPLHHLGGEPNGFRCIASSPDGRHLVAGGDFGASLYDMNLAVVTALATAKKDDAVTACAFSRDGKSVALIWRSGRLSAHPADAGKELGWKETNWPDVVAGSGRDVVFVGDRVAGAGASPIVQLGSLGGAQETLTSAAGPLYRLTALGNGKLLAGCGDDGALRLWNTELTAPRTQRAILLAPVGGSLRAVGFSPCGRYLAAGGDNGAVYLTRQAFAGQVAQVVPANAGLSERFNPVTRKPPLRQIAAASQGLATFALYGYEDGSVEQESLSTAQGSAPKASDWAKGAITALALSREGLAVSASKDRMVRGREAGTGRLRWQKEVTADVSLVSIAEDGSQVAAVIGKEVVLWQADTGTEVSRFAPALQVTSLALSADGGQILLGTATGPLLLCDHDGKEVRRLLGHRGRVNQVAFTANTMYSAGADGTVRRWDSGGKETRQYLGHTGEVIDLCVSPNGKMLMTTGADRTVRLWVAAGGERDRVLLAGRGVPRQLRCSGRHLIGLTEEGARTTWTLPKLAAE